MPADYSEHWNRLYQQKKHAFLEEQCAKALDISSSDDLEDSFGELLSRYGQQIKQESQRALTATLQNVNSFAILITTAAQYDSIANAVWGANQAVIEAACANSQQLEEAFAILAELNAALPQLDEYLEPIQVYGEELQWSLHDLYDDYVDYCISAIQHFKTKSSTISGQLSNLNKKRKLDDLEGSPDRTLNTHPVRKTEVLYDRLRRTKEKIVKHAEEFRDDVAHIRKRTTRQQRKSSRNTSQSSAPGSVSTNRDSLDTNFATTVTMYRNYSFTGRDVLLERMHEALHGRKKSKLLSRDSVPALRKQDTQHSTEMEREGSSGPAVCVLHGIGGVGKTQTALEYSYRFKKSYSAIFWLPSERDPDLQTAFSSIADKLSLVADDGTGENKAEKVQRARRWLEDTARRWLLIFDNVEDLYDLNQYLPLDTDANGAIIITTQHTDFHPITAIFEKMNIESFDKKDSAELLLRHLEREVGDEDEETAAEDIARLVGGLPLAISTIGGYVNQSSSSLREIYENLKRSSNVFEASAVGAAKQYEKTLETVFDIAFAELPIRTRNFLNVLAFLNPDSVPEDIFTAHFKNPAFDFVKTKNELIESVRILRRRQLIRRDVDAGKGYLSVHRTVQWNVLLDLSKDYDSRWEVFRQTLTFLRRGMPKTSPLDIPEPEKWPEFEKYVPQVLTVRTHCLWPEPPVDLPTDFAEVLSDLSTYMWHAGLADEGNEALHTAIDIMDDKGVSKADERRSDVYAKLGILLSYNGVSDRPETMKRRLQALDIREKTFAKLEPGDVTRNDEIRLYNVKCDLAWTWLHEGDYAKAEPIMDDCLEKYKSWGTEKEIPFEYAKYCTLMAFVRLTQQRPDLAVELSGRGAELIQKAAGEEHPVTQMWHFAYGNVLANAGKVEEALTVNEEVRKNRIKLCGEFNHMTLESYSTCAALLLRTNKLNDARSLLEKCLERRKRAVWNAEGVARAQYRYAQVLERLGETEESRRIGQLASNTRRHFVKRFPDRLVDATDEETVFDQMVSVWDGRLTNPLNQQS